MAGVAIKDEALTRKRLNVIRVVAIIDAFLLVPLLIAAVSGSDLVHILGPIHGTGFLILIGLVLRGVAEGLWGWWFPALVVVTLGPPGSLLGDLRIRRSLSA